MIDEGTIEEVVAFHGHMCPGLAMGVQVAQIALREIGRDGDDEDVVAQVETGICAVDAIQRLTGCTSGKGNLIQRDWGKNAYTFWRRSDGRGVRIVWRPDAWDREAEHESLLAKVLCGTATPDEHARFGELHLPESRRLLEADADDLYDLQEVHTPPPAPPRIYATVVCGRCGEGAMESRIHRLDGRVLCEPCFEAVVAGEELVDDRVLAAPK